MEYLVVGVNHKTAPVAIREKLSVNHERSQQMLEKILAAPYVHEAVVLSTCNRTEIYCAASRVELASQILRSAMLSPLSKQEPSLSDGIAYDKNSKEAIGHLFEVTSSLDSQIIGETQIARQVKQAYLSALSSGATGIYLNRLFERALFVSKRVRSETNISKGNVSLGSAAVTLAKKIFGSWSEAAVLLLGLGEIGQLVVRALNGHLSQKTWLMTRSFDKACRLQEQGLGLARPVSDLPPALIQADILITALGKTLPELSSKSLQETMRARKQKPLFMIDLGMPRNIDSLSAIIENVHLYNLDDLRHISEQTLKNRAGTLLKAKNIIEEEAALFYASLPTRKGAVSPRLDDTHLLNHTFRLDGGLDTQGGSHGQ